MKICYVDESGDLQLLPSPDSSVQPVMVVLSIFVDQRKLPELTHRFLEVKSRYFPKLFKDKSKVLNKILVEIKGEQLRKQMRSASRNERRHAIVFLDKVLGIAEALEIQLAGRVFVKAVGEPIKGTSLYTSSIQEICDTFQSHLVESNNSGILILDSRYKQANTQVSHSIFTQKFRYEGGDPYSRILEMPTFGHSDNHAGLQMADLICSALICPIACFAFCLGKINNVHVNSAYGELQQSFGKRLQALQFRYQDPETKWWHGGLRFTDSLGRRSKPHIHFFGNRDRS